MIVKKDTKNGEVEIGSNLLEYRGLPEILYNNDSDDLKFPAYGHESLWVPEGNQPELTPLKSFNDYLSWRIGPLAESCADGLSYCGNFGIKIWEIQHDRIPALGDDPFLDIRNFWKKEPGRSFYFSVRMNDKHHEWLDWPHLWTDYYKENRHLFLNPPSEEYWKNYILPWINHKAKRPEIEENAFCLDYSKIEVRKHYLSIIEEASQRYELDGFELDWLRFPKYFKEGEESVTIMTEFVEKIHRILESNGLKHGKKLKLVCRVHETPEESLAVGLDVKAWIKAGFLDAVIAGHGLTFSSNPIRTWIDIAHPEKVAVYGCLERANFGKRKFDRYGTPEGLRSAVATLRHLGMDGLYLFNYYLPKDYPLFEDFIESDRMSRLPKEYFTDSGNACVLPASLKPGEMVLAPLVIADDPGSVAEISMELVWEGKIPEETPTVRINGIKIEGGISVIKEPCFITTFSNNCNLRAALKKGINEVSVTAKNLTTIDTVNLRVKP